MRSTTLLLMLSLAALSAGCARNSGDFCDIAKPQRPSATTFKAMNDREKADLVKLNEQGERECGWKPSTK